MKLVSVLEGIFDVGAPCNWVFNIVNSLVTVFTKARIEQQFPQPLVGCSWQSCHYNTFTLLSGTVRIRGYKIK